MPGLDDRLHRWIDSVAQLSPAPEGLLEEIERRRSVRQVRRRVVRAGLSLAVLVGTVGMFLVLQDAFRTEQVAISPTPPTPTPEMPPIALDPTVEGEWVIAALVENGEQVPMVPGDRGAATLTIDGTAGNYGGYGGCNSYGGSTISEGDGIGFRRQIQTAMLCSERLVTQETSLAAALRRVAGFELSGDGIRLSLTGSRGAVLVSLVRPDYALLHLPGVRGPVCRPMSVPGEFGGQEPEEVVVFEVMRGGATECATYEGFQYAGIRRLSDGTVTSYTLIGDIGQDQTSLWPYATPDVDDDGVAELAIGIRGSEGAGFARLALYRLGIVPGSFSGDARAWERVVINCGQACEAVQYLNVGAVQRDRVGWYCSPTDSVAVLVPPTGTTPPALAHWWTLPGDEPDTLVVHQTLWGLVGADLRQLAVVAPDLTLPVDGEGYPPSGLDQLCGSPTYWPEDFPDYLWR